MAQSKNNHLTRGLSGTIGRQLVFRQLAGRTVVSGLPKPFTGEVSASQQQVRDRFQEAIRYGKTVMSDLASKALYAARAIKGVSAFNLATADFVKPPVVKSINTDAYLGAVGNFIEVNAFDDFMVKSVEVSLLAADGSLIEKGAAVKGLGDTWSYAATVAHAPLPGTKITAVAKDLPGNATSLDKQL